MKISTLAIATLLTSVVFSGLVCAQQVPKDQAKMQPTSKPTSSLSGKIFFPVGMTKALEDSQRSKK